jgi:monoamine oxidase
VISTLPVGVLKSNAIRFDPVLPKSKQAALSQMEMGPITKILLHFEKKFWPGWVDMVACATGPINLYWSTFRNVKERPSILTCYCVGPRATELAKVSEEKAIGIIMADLQRLFPKASPDRALVNYRFVKWGEDPFARGGYSFLRPGARNARASLRAADTGALYWAGSGTESQPVSELVETAYRSGLRVAAEVSADLKSRDLTRTDRASSDQSNFV